MSEQNERDVAGEPVGALQRALSYIRTRDDRNGMMRFDMEIPAQEALPLQRALMRVEAALLLDDADGLTGPDVRVRSVDERRADALVTLARHIANARDEA